MASIDPALDHDDKTQPNGVSPFPCCQHARYTPKSEDGLTLCRCDDCGHTWTEVPL